MSTLSVDTITKADGSGSLSVPAESGTVVTTASPSLGRRNLILNGSMAISQRGTSFTGQTTATYTTVDRFFWNMSDQGSPSTFVITSEQSTDAPDGFSNSFKATVTTAATDVQFLICEQRIEDRNLQMLDYGGSNPQQVTASFWVKSSNTGTAVAALYQRDVARVGAVKFTINQADTWEYKTVSFPIDTEAQGIMNNNGDDGLRLWLILDGGGTWAGGTQLDNDWMAWQSGNYNRIASDVDTNIAGAVNNYVNITGVQLEVGSVATPFEHRSYGEELALCQRYFQRTDAFRYFPITRWHHNSGTPLAEYRMAVPMRSTVSVSVTPGATFASGSGYTGTPTFGGQTDKAFHITSATSRNANDNQWVHNGSLDIDAEL